MQHEQGELYRIVPVEVKLIQKKKKNGSHIYRVKDYSNSGSDHFLFICKEKLENVGKHLVG